MSSQKPPSPLPNTSFRVISHTPNTSPMFPRTSNSSVSVSYGSSASRRFNPATPAPSPRRLRDKVGRPVTAPQDHVKTSGSGGVEDVRPRTPKSEGRNRSGGRSPKSKPRVSTLLPPRKISSMSTFEGESGVERGGTGQVVKIETLHFADGYTPHKCHWVKKAIEQLGSEWVTSGKITVEDLKSEVFHEKMGVLYDLAMARKHEAIDRLVNEEVGGSGKVGKGKKSKEPKVPANLNFPFAEHVTKPIKESMSNALLSIMMRSEESTPVKKKEKEVTSSKKKVEKEDNSSSSNSFERSLKKRKHSLVQCYVFDGRLVVGTKDKMLSVGGSFVNRFGESKLSRARRTPPSDGTPYFRQTCNMMGFQPHEVNIRFCKNSRQLIVSGARPKRGNENARQVRETIEIPKSLDISTLVVLRTTKGSLIFEEVEVEVKT